MRIPAVLAALALSALASSALLAHVELTASTPATGSETKAPKAITLTFNEPVNQASAAASIVMTAMPGMPNHGEMLMRNFTSNWSADGKTLTLSLKQALPKGTYEVRWQAAAADGHAISGTVNFEVT